MLLEKYKSSVETMGDRTLEYGIYLYPLVHQIRKRVKKVYLVVQ